MGGSPTAIFLALQHLPERGQYLPSLSTNLVGNPTKGSRFNLPWSARTSHNGERYIADQISSILAQSIAHWRSIVRDDGSADKTIEVVETFLGNPRISFVQGNRGRGAQGNFSELMHLALQTDARYIMLVDQDDVWHPQKNCTPPERNTAP